MMHPVVKQMEVKGQIEEEAIVIEKCSSCNSEIYYGEYYYSIEHGFYESIHCEDCTSKKKLGEE